MKWRWVLASTAGLFGAGVAAGVAAQKRGIPQDQVPRWLAKELLRRGLRVADAVRDELPGEHATALSEAMDQPPPRPNGAPEEQG